MMTGKLLINGKDAWTEWRVFLEDGYIDRFMLPSAMKPYIENKSRSEHGTQILMKDARMDQRDLTLVFCFAPVYGIQEIGLFMTSQFDQKFNAFMAEIMSGKQVMGSYYPNEIGLPELNKIFKLIYISSVELTSMGNKMGKIAIRFTEPNPAIRPYIIQPDT